MLAYTIHNFIILYFQFKSAKMLIFPYLLQRISDKIIQNQLSWPQFYWTLEVRKYQHFCRFELENMSIYDILPTLDPTQSVHAKISIGMHRGVKFKIYRIPLIGLETRLGWRTDRKFNPTLEAKSDFLSGGPVAFSTKSCKKKKGGECSRPQFC
jgi:hypothetical protein